VEQYDLHLKTDPELSSLLSQYSTIHIKQMGLHCGILTGKTTSTWAIELT
jgi:hypothetical protein